MNFVQQFLNLGASDTDSLLKKRGKRIYNFDILSGVYLPLLAELGLQWSAYNTPQTTIFNIAIALFFAPHLLLVIKKKYELSVILVQIVSFVFVIFGVFVFQGLMTSLFFLAIGLNAFIYFPGKKKLAGGVFLFFVAAAIVFLGWEVWMFDLEKVNAAFLVKWRIGMSTFVFLFLYKIFSLIALYWTTMDEKEESQDALEESEVKYRSFFEKVKIGIATEVDGRFVSVNPEMSNLIGYTEAELIKMRPKDIIHPDDYNKAKETFDRAMIDASIPKEIPHRVVTKDGRTLDVLVTFAPLIEGGEVNDEIIVTMSNLTPIKAAEKALVHTEDRFRSLFENAFDGIFIYDSKVKKPQHCNRKLAETFGVTCPKVLNNFPNGFFPKYQSNGTESIAFLKEQERKVLLEGKVKFMVDTLKPDGTLLIAEVNTFNLPKPNSHLNVSIFRDITEQQKQEAIIQQNISELNQKNSDLEKYIESNLQLENFAYIASHDLKAPIRTIGSFSKLLKRKAASKLDETELEFLDFINKGAENMSKLVEDLLTYSKANTENHQLDLINMHNLLEMIVHELGVSIEENNAEINISDIPKTIYADSTKMRQLFQNLIANAIKFKKPMVNPVVNITCKEDSNSWYFSVSDNGIGIKPEFHEKVFMLFRKLHGSNEYEGSGIGLSLCKKIVEQHFGTISIDSEYGQFTRFDFSIKKS